MGAAHADVILVVFADYACPACRDAQLVIDQLLAQDRKLKVVYRLVDNDQGGRTAALTSLAVAASKSADWGKFHLALDASGDLSSKAIADAVAASGVEPAKLPHVENADDPQTLSLAQELSHNDLLINQRHGTALPAWLIGDGPAQKGFDLPRLQAAIAKARAGPKRWSRFEACAAPVSTPALHPNALRPVRWALTPKRVSGLSTRFAEPSSPSVVAPSA